MIGHHTRFGENDDFPAMAEGQAEKKKPPFFQCPC